MSAGGGRGEGKLRWRLAHVDGEADGGGAVDVDYVAVLPRFGVVGGVVVFLDDVGGEAEIEDLGLPVG